VDLVNYGVNGDEILDVEVQLKAEKGRERQRKAEKGRERQEEAEKGRERQRKAESVDNARWS